VRILAHINHPNIISYKEAFLDEEKLNLCIVIEYADDKDLFQKIKQRSESENYFPENQIWLIFLQLLQALNTLHKNRIMHRDLKSANVFMNKDLTAKLGDMNVSRLADTQGLNYTQTGTPYYACPEVWKDKPYDFKSDIWSLG
jgi:NIMA (never in mitosis gene a)-related kinase 1/4/5